MPSSTAHKIVRVLQLCISISILATAAFLLHYRTQSHSNFTNEPLASCISGGIAFLYAFWAILNHRRHHHLLYRRHYRHGHRTTHPSSLSQQPLPSDERYSSQYLSSFGSTLASGPSSNDDDDDTVANKRVWVVIHAIACLIICALLLVAAVLALVLGNRAIPCSRFEMAQGQGVFVAPSEPPLPIASSVISIPFISDYVHLSSRATPYSTWAPSTSVQRRYSEYQDGQTYGPNEMCLNRYSEMDKACAVLGIVAAILWLIDFGFIIGICGSRIRSNDCDQRCADGNSSRDRSPWMGETVEVNAITGAGLNHLGMAGAGGRRRSIRRGQIGPDSSYDPENDDYPAGIGFNSNGHRQNLRGSNTYCPNRGCRHSGMREIESYSYEGDEDGCFQQEDYYDTLDQRKGKGLVASLSNWKKRHSSATMASTPVSRASDKDKDQEQQQQQQQHNSTQWRLFGGAIGKTSSRRRGSEPVQSILTNLSQKNTGTNDERPDDLRGDYGPGGMNDYPPGMVMPSIQKPTATLISTPLCDTPLMRDCVESTMLPMRFPDNSIQSNNSKDSNSIAMSESTISQQPQLMHQTSFGSVEAAPTVLSPPPRPRNRWQQQLAEGGAGDGTSGGSSGPGTAVSSTSSSPKPSDPQRIDAPSGAIGSLDISSDSVGTKSLGKDPDAATVVEQRPSLSHPPSAMTAEGSVARGQTPQPQDQNAGDAAGELCTEDCHISSEPCLEELCCSEGELSPAPFASPSLEQTFQMSAGTHSQQGRQQKPARLANESPRGSPRPFDIPPGASCYVFDSVNHEYLPSFVNVAARKEQLQRQSGASTPIPVESSTYAAAETDIAAVDEALVKSKMQSNGGTGIRKRPAAPRHLTLPPPYLSSDPTTPTSSMATPTDSPTMSIPPALNESDPGPQGSQVQAPVSPVIMTPTTDPLSSTALAKKPTLATRKSSKLSIVTTMPMAIEDPTSQGSATAVPSSARVPRRRKSGSAVSAVSPMASSPAVTATSHRPQDHEPWSSSTLSPAGEPDRGQDGGENRQRGEGGKGRPRRDPSLSLVTSLSSPQSSEESPRSPYIGDF